METTKRIAMPALAALVLSACSGGGGRVATMPESEPGAAETFLAMCVDMPKVWWRFDYASRPESSAIGFGMRRFYKAMGAAFGLAEREAAGEAEELFSALRFDYLAEGRSGGIRSYTDTAMSEALGSLPGDTCRAVTGQIAEAYEDLRQSLKWVDDLIIYAYGGYLEDEMTRKRAKRAVERVSRAAE